MPEKTFQIMTPGEHHAFLDIDLTCFVAYLNGQEIAREGIGNPWKTPPGPDVARTSPSQIGLRRRPFPLPGGELQDHLASGRTSCDPLPTPQSTSTDLTLSRSSPLGNVRFRRRTRPRPISCARASGLHTNFKIGRGGALTLTSPRARFSTPSTGILRRMSRWAAFRWLGRFLSRRPTPASQQSRASSAGELPVSRTRGGFHPGPITLALSVQDPAATIHSHARWSAPTQASPATRSHIMIDSTTSVRAEGLAARVDPEGGRDPHVFIGSRSPSSGLNLPRTRELFDEEIGILRLRRSVRPQLPLLRSHFWRTGSVGPPRLFEPGGTSGFSVDAGAKSSVHGAAGTLALLAFYARNRHGRVESIPDLSRRTSRASSRSSCASGKRLDGHHFRDG